MLVRIVLALTLAVACGGVAAAQTDARADLVQKLGACQKIANDQARLACYDEAAGALTQAQAKGDIVIVDREQAQTVRRQAFGFHMPSINLFGKADTKEELESVTDTLASARRDAAGRWTFRMESGAIWSQVAPEEPFKTPKPGMAATIRKAALGSFVLQLDNQGVGKVHRVE